MDDLGLIKNGRHVRNFTKDLICLRLHIWTYLILEKLIPSGLTDPKLRVNEDAFLPGRNLVSELAGAAHAYKVQANSVAIGLLDPADRLFPDQTKEFLQDAERVIETAIGRRISVLAPLINFTKKDVLVMASERGIEQTYSCHSGTDKPCGVCIACLEITNAKGEK